MAIALDPIQIVSFEELLMSQVVSQEALLVYLSRRGYLPKMNFGDVDALSV